VLYSIPGTRLATLQRRVVRQIVATKVPNRRISAAQRDRLVARVVKEQVRLLEERDERHRAIRDRILCVLEDGSLRVAFQPIVDLVDGSVVGVEALARFRTEPVRSPAQWFAEARTVGLGRELELAALRAAVAQLRRLPSQMFMSINVSPKLLTRPTLWTLLGEVSPERLVLEITEHSRIAEYGRVREVVDSLRTLGARLAIDDVGAGFASLKHVLVLEPDLMKLDISLTRDLHLNPARQLLVASIASFASEMSAAVVAEGVETPEELKTLGGLGVRYGQGYLFGRPASLARATRSA